MILHVNASRRTQRIHNEHNGLLSIVMNAFIQ